MNYVRNSILLHFGLILFFLLMLFVSDKVKLDEPIEITEFIRNLGTPTNEPKKLVKKSSNTQNKKISDSSNSSTSNTAPSATQGSPQGSEEGVAEDYEVNEMPILLNEVRIPYPPEAKQKKIQGGVIFNILIGSDGTVKKVQLVSSPDESLTKAAENAVRSFKFRPAKMAQKPVAIRIRYTYRFLIQ